MSDNNSAPTPEPPAPLKPPPANVPAQAPAPDPWKERLKENMRRDRNRMRQNVAVAAVVLALLAAVGLWWMYPGPPLPALFTVAFDGLGVPGEDAQVRLQIEPVDAALPFPPNLAGLKVTFEDVTRPVPPLAKLVTDKFGRALADVHFTEKAEARFRGRFDGNRQLKPSLDLAKITFIPPGSALVLVDVQDLLADPDLDIATKDLNQIQPHQPTAKSLQTLHGEKKRIVYLALRGERAQGYQMARRWLGIKGQLFPPGPILGRPSYHDDKSAEDAHRQIVGELSGQWKVTAVGRRRECADFYRQVDIPYRDLGKQ